MPVLCSALVAEPEKLLLLPVFTLALSTCHKSIQLDLLSADECFPILLARYHANIQRCERFCLFSWSLMKAEMTWSLGQQMSHESSRNWFWSHCQLCGWTPQLVSFHKNDLQKGCEKTWMALEKCVQIWQIIWLYITLNVSPMEHCLGQSTKLWETWTCCLNLSFWNPGSSLLCSDTMFFLIKAGYWAVSRSMTQVTSLLISSKSFPEASRKDGETRTW